MRSVNTIIIIFGIVFSLISSSKGFESNANKVNPNDRNDPRQRPYTRDNASKPLGQGGYYGGHDTITAEGMLLKKEVHKENTKFQEWADDRITLPHLRIGAHDEDSTKTGPWYIKSEPPIGRNGDGNFYQHFYDPDTGKGLLKGLLGDDSALNRAKNYDSTIRSLIGCSSIDKLSGVERERIFDYFGRILHLIEDMGIPSHTKIDPHVGEPFEKYVNDHWDEIVNSDYFRDGVTVDEYLKGKFDEYSIRDISKFIIGLARKSKGYWSDNELYDLVWDPNIQQYKPAPNQEKIMQNARNLIPETIRYVAGYIDAIYKFITGPPPERAECEIKSLQPTNPGNDHPDDRFDVSDEFYWEREFGLSDLDLTNFYLRTGIKKGKVGLWYKKRFIEIYGKARHEYDNLSEEAKERIRTELKRIFQELESRQDQIESDWKGAPDIALFTNGFYKPSISLMLKIGEPVSFQNIDFNPEIVKDHPVLLVPTGGFYGLKDSTMVKALLDEYVKNGGTLVVFAQQHGYDWGLLPTPVNLETGERKPIAGYGYQEDQSCQYNSVYIDTYHPMLSVFSTPTANIGVDGYFTSYPESSTVLLRRVSNGQPAMIVYPYGNGYVIATTMYTDFAFTHNQANQTEINFVQNIISWGKKPTSLIEVKPGEIVSLNVEARNFMNVDASIVKFTILDPARKVVTEETQSITILAGQSVTIPVNYASTKTSTLGIYHIDYTLLDASANIIQPQAETDSGRFVVSNPPTIGYKGSGITFSVQSDSEDYVAGSTVNLTIIAFNNSEVDRRVTAKFFDWNTFSIKTETIVVPAKGSNSFPYSKLARPEYNHYGHYYDNFYVSFYENEVYIGASTKIYWVYLPSIKITVQTDKNLYKRGETVTINIPLKNNIPFSWTQNVEIMVKESSKDVVVFRESKTVTLPPLGTDSIVSTFLLPPTSTMGTYVVHVFYSGYWNWSYVYTRFDVVQSQILVQANPPSVLNSRNNVFPFTITNIGKIGISSGTIDLSLIAPDGNIVFSGSHPFSLEIGETKTLNIPISISSLKLGAYVLTYSQSDETKTGKPTSINFLNSSSLNISMDKPSYKIGETANITVSTTNTGRFVQEASVIMDIPFLRFSETKSITINPSLTESILFSFSLPLTLNQGGTGKVILALSSGDRIEREIYLPIKPVRIEQDILFDKDLYRIRENLGFSYTITSDSNFTSPLNASFSLSIPDINYTYGGSLTLEPGQRKEVPFIIPIPETLLPGIHYVNVTLTLPWEMSLTKEVGFVVPESSLLISYSGATSLKAGDTISLSIENTGGVDTTYTIEKFSIKDSMNVDIYRTSGFGTLLASEKKSLNLQIPLQTVKGLVYLGVRIRDDKTGRSAFMDKIFDIQGLSAFLETRTDKRAYLNTEPIAITSSVANGPIGIIEGNLKVIVKGIKTGSNDELKHFLPREGWKPINYPGGMAVGFGRYLYVADTGNHRVLKFEDYGNFVMEWGGYGSDEGKFDSPSGIAVGFDGSVYVADTNNHRIQKFDSNGRFIAQWGGYGEGDGQFKSPIGIAFDGDSIYVLDSDNYRIQKFDRDGNFILKWGRYGSGEDEFYSPSGIAVGNDWGYTIIYVADSGNGSIKMFNSSGYFLKQWYCYYTEYYDDYNHIGSITPRGIAVGGSESYMSVVVTDGLYHIATYDGWGDFLAQWQFWGYGNDGYQRSYGITATPWIYSTPNCEACFYIYIADFNNHIQMFDSEGNFVYLWAGGAGNGDGRFNYPTDIAVGPEGYIYVVDMANNRIQKFDDAGNFITKWGGYGNGMGQFKWPNGIAIDSDGSVYIADTWNHRVQKFTSNGDFVSQWGTKGEEDGQFFTPRGLAIDLDGYIYVVDSNDRRIQKFDRSGNFITEWGGYGNGDGEFDDPLGITVGSDGSVYVVDTGNHRIQKFNSDGNFIATWGSFGWGDGQFISPQGIAATPDGFLFVTDWGNRIQKFDLNGGFIHKWGGYGTGDGEFWGPKGIAIEPDGPIYIVDYGNHRIQRMIPEGISQTIFETSIPIHQSANSTQNYVTNIGTREAKGKLYLQGILSNKLGQTISRDDSSFYIFDGNTFLLFATDKKIYKSGEIVTITGRIENLAPIEATGLVLVLNSKHLGQTSQILREGPFDIPAGGSHSFTFNIPADKEGEITLIGEVQQSGYKLVEIVEGYEVTRSKVAVSISVPEVVGNQPFDINVEIKNTGKVDATIQFGIQDSEFKDSQTLTISAGEIKILQYTQQILSDTTYTFTFMGDLEQKIQRQVRFGEKAEIELTLYPSYKEGDIIIPYQLKNIGELETTFPVTFTLFGDGQEISKTIKIFMLPVNGSILDSLRYKLGVGSYLLRCESRGFRAESRIDVAKARQGEITLVVNEFYPEGMVILPYKVKNTGTFDEEFAFEFELGPPIISNAVFIPAGGEYSDYLHFNLPSGNYTIKAILISEPSSLFSKSFRVLKENIAEMLVSLGAQVEGLIPVNIHLTNLGYNDISGSVSLSVMGGSGKIVWNAEKSISQLLAQDSQLVTLNINPSAIEPGNYNLQAKLLSNSNQLIALKNLEFLVQSPNFQITKLPSYQTFVAGQEALFEFRIKNTGNQEGSFDLLFKSYDLIDSVKRDWLKPGEERIITFSFILPEDLEEKDYFASYELKDSRGQEVEGTKGQIKYHLAGIRLNVNAFLDKANYNEGETAHLTINIQTTNPNPQPLFVRVNYKGYESQQALTLEQGQIQSLQFDIPLPQITGEKLFYGVYQEGGRSIHLNSLYIHKAGDVITVTTDQQVYKPGEVVSVTVSGNASGKMTLSGPGGYEETFAFSGQITKNFTLPSTMIAGTYFIHAILVASNPGTITVSHPFDVAGILVKVLECKNDRGKYASSDLIKTSLNISSNTTMPALLKMWIVDPSGQYITAGEQSISLSSSENSLVTYNSSLVTEVSGIHRLVYGIYGPEGLLLCSGGEAFDVGDAILMGLSTNKRDYSTNTEPVIITATLFGSIAGELQFELDGTVIKREMVLLNGLTTYSTQIQEITPGPHVLKGTLTAGALKSTKEISFTYALAFMPKPMISASPTSLEFGSINLGSSSTQKITLSSIGNKDLVIGMITLSGTNQEEFSIRDDGCSGQTLSPSGNCTLDILFLPTSLGPKSALLSIPSNSTNFPTLTLPIRGGGVAVLSISVNPPGSGRVSGEGIECPDDCTETFSVKGAAIQLTATPTEGNRFVNWSGDINSLENPVSVIMDGHRNVTANFTINTCKITATASLGGTISPSGSITLNYGASQTFILTPNLGYHIGDVRVDGVSIGPAFSYIFENIHSDHTIEAIFAINPYTITATAGSNGAILPSGIITVNHGETQTFLFKPNQGYRIAEVKVDGISMGKIETYTFNNVTSNHTIEVTFAIDNNPPVANAGRDQNVITGQVVTLDGSESFDPEGEMITFLWQFKEVPLGSNVTNASLSEHTSAKPEFIPDVDGTYRVQLIVNDGLSDSDPDEVLIHAFSKDVPPNANAGHDQNVLTGTPVQLDGSRSSDPDNGPKSLSYLWSVKTKPSGSQLKDNSILNWDRANATFTPDINGLYELTLTVSDSNLSSDDTVRILATPSNVPPNANAGEDTLAFLGEKVMLNGSLSNDLDHGPKPITCNWRFVAIPVGSRLTNHDISDADTFSPSFIPDVIGTYVLQLMVFDGEGWGFDNVAVTVVDNIAPTLAPVANLTTLWPPDHRMVDIIIRANASDNSHCPVNLRALVKSNEPQEGLGDGDTSPDWTEPVIDEDSGVITLKLRAERSGKGKGRIYTITITASDASNNSSQASVEIKVPHSQGKK